MSEPYSSIPDQLRHMMEQVRGTDSQSFRNQLEDMAAKLNSVNGRTYRGYAGPESDNELVAAEVDHRGAVTQIEISPHAMLDMDADTLAQACTEALYAARVELTNELNGLLEELPGDGQHPGGTGADDLFAQAKEMASWLHQTFTR